MAATNYTIINGQPYVWNPGSYGKKDWSGTATPTAYGSFGLNVSWNGLSLSTLFTYSLGSKVYDGIYAGKMGISATPSSAHVDNLKSWTEAPAGMTVDSPNRIDPNGVPMLYTFNTYNMDGTDVSISNNAGTSTRWLVSGNYLVIKNITLSYELPKKLLKPLQMQGLSVNVTCENLATFSARKGLNPQYNFSGTTSSNDFVTARVISGGLTLRF